MFDRQIIATALDDIGFPVSRHRDPLGFFQEKRLFEENTAYGVISKSVLSPLSVVFDPVAHLREIHGTVRDPECLPCQAYWQKT
jgi:hypothetical protein